MIRGGRRRQHSRDRFTTAGQYASHRDRWNSRWSAFRTSASLYGVIGLGSIIGGTARWGISVVMQSGTDEGFPAGTLTVNIVGSFLIGFYDALAGPDGRLFAGPRQRQFVMAGICGGFTTFSIFSFESVALIGLGRFGTAGLFVAASVAGWLAAVWAGYALATTISRVTRR